MRLLLPTIAAAALLCACANPAPRARWAPAPAEPEVLALPRPAGGEWLGLYLLGSKAGWLHADVAADTFDGEPAVRSEMEMRLEVAVDGNVASRVAIDRRWYARRPGGRLLGFESVRAGDGGERRTTARCDERVCVVRLLHEQGEERREIPLPPETVDDADPVRKAAIVRGTVRSTWLDLDELAVRRSVHRFVGAADGLVRVATRDEDETLDELTVLDAALATREVQVGPAVIGRAEPRDEARTLGSPADIFALTRVPLPAPLPEAPRHVVLEVEGLPEALWRDDARQRFEPLGGGAVRVTIDADARPAADPAARAPGFLASTPTVDWETPAVRALAARIAGEAGPDAAARADALVRHVSRTLQKSYGTSSDRASRVLAQGRGDCTEHALLFVALARAAGLPARQVHGLVHADTGPGAALYWHEWAEVWVDGAWRAVDPTFGQMPADATHLRLGEGRTASSTAALGQLRIRRAEAR